MKRNIYGIIVIALISCILPHSSVAEIADTVDSVPAISERINQTEYIEIIQPAALTDRLRQATNESSDESTQRQVSNRRSGYRIQIYDSNARGARDEAQRRKYAVQSRMGVNAYIRFDSPYWRVRVGDFTSRGEAEHALSDLKRLFPGYAGSFRIVRDHINHVSAE